jgi:hypothetical protein
MKSQIIEQVVYRYLNSGDFNGLSFTTLEARLSAKKTTLLKVIADLVKNDQLEVIYGDYHPNPHIKAFSGLDKGEQITKLKNSKLLNQACLYPHPNVLKNRPEIDKKYADRPYTKELALGAGHLDFRAFDLAVLEIYRNDPRYHYYTNDISGWIAVTDKHYSSEEMPASDKALLNTFGFCYNAAMDRAVAVFLRYLTGLTPEHQMIWKSKELTGEYKLHPDYYRNSILGDWGTGISIFDAFIMELEIVNIMCSSMSKPPLFKQTFKESRPREFSFLLRPTLSEFNSFIHLLDKMMSDNLEKNFFKGQIRLETDAERADGKIVVTQKGTIQLLEEWITKYFRSKDPSAANRMFSVFKEIRKLRQKPAHSINENEFDQKYFKEQRRLAVDAYNAVRSIRIILANHPAVKANPPKIDELLQQGKIWDF